MVAKETWSRFLAHVGNLAGHFKVFPTLNVKAFAALSIFLMTVMLFFFVRWRSRRRSSDKKKIVINCWFCNTDNIVNAKEKDMWYCKKCDQYNGFTNTGDYNKDIAEIYANHTDSLITKHSPFRQDNLCSDSAPCGFKLCDICNKMQILKVKQLATFVPRNEAYFDYEVDDYKQQLERRYKLCNICSMSLRRHLLSQDMQIKETYGQDFQQHNWIADSDEKEHRKRQLSKNREKRKRTFFNLSFLWPSSLLSLVSLACSIFLCFVWLTGQFKAKVFNMIYFGCTARFFMWLLNPLSIKKLVYLIVWSCMGMLTAVPMLAKIKFMPALPVLILAIEIWDGMWTGFIISTSWGTFRRLTRLKSALKTSKKLPKKRSPKVSVMKKSNSEAKNELVVVQQRRPNQDNIDGRIDAMSLGLTDSEDDTKQYSRVKDKKVAESWYASASRFVEESGNRKARVENEDSSSGQKFQLLPSKLSLFAANSIEKNVIQEEKQSVHPSQKETTGRLVQRKIDNTRQRNEPYLDKKQNVGRPSNDSVKSFKKEEVSECTCMKYLLIVLVFVALFSSIALNVYLLKKN